MQSDETIVIVDYGLGNLLSIKNMIKKVGGNSIISSDKDVIAEAKKLLLPGVGNFKYGIDKINNLGFRDLLDEKVLVDKVPVLGICLGMQLMTNSSEEGDCQGLGWVDAETIKFQFDSQELKVPHMGWNEVEFRDGSVFDLDYHEPTPRFYFVHSYFVKCNNNADIIAETTYGIKYTCGFKKDNIMGLQFHPEKSHKFGMNLMKKFVVE